MQAFVDLFSTGGQVALVVAELAFVAVVWLAMLWKPRHRSQRRGHDCRLLGCPWLDDRPK